MYMAFTYNFSARAHTPHILHPSHAHTLGNVNKATDAKIAVYTCAFDSMATETKGTVLLKTANELLEFSKTEEDLIEGQVKALSDAGFKVVVAGGKFGEMALHFLNKYNIMAVRCGLLIWVLDTVVYYVVLRNSSGCCQSLTCLDCVRVLEPLPCLKWLGHSNCV